jgi:hypothetical protein
VQEAAHGSVAGTCETEPREATRDRAVLAGPCERSSHTRCSQAGTRAGRLARSVG